MSKILDPISLQNIPPFAFGSTVPVQLVIQPERISAVRVFNSSPYSMKINNLPGQSEAWLGSYMDEVYRASNSSSSFYSTVSGIITLTPYNNQLVTDVPSQVGGVLQFGKTVYITVYEIGDTIPDNLPVHHTQLVNISGDVKQPMTILSVADVAGGAQGVVSMTIADVASGNNNNVQSFYTVLDGFSIDFTNSAAQHNFALSIAGITNNPFNMRFNIPATAAFSIFRNDLRWASFQAGEANNTISLTVPAISSGPQYTMVAWFHQVAQSL